LKNKAPVILRLVSLAIDDTVSSTVLTLYSDCFAKKINVAVAVAGVGSRLDDNNITVIGIINRRLDCGIIARAIGVDVDCPRWRCHGYAKQKGDCRPYPHQKMCV
jgi:hypothetical protein